MSSKVVFLDRDGVINKEKPDYVKDPNEFELLPGVEKWLKLLVANNFKLIIVTNQSMIGRGLSTIKQLHSINKKMQDYFSKHGFQIDKIYWCPHTPEDNCECRKPKTKLFLDAIKEYRINIEKSWLIGDKNSDILAGKRIGCNTIKIQTNSSLERAVLTILNNS